MLNFDDNRTWGPLLTDAIGDLISKSILDRFVAAAPEYVEDARALLFDWTDRDRVIDATLTWMRSTTIMGYHGTRLIDAEVDSIRAHGLLPLEAEARRARLVRALCQPTRGGTRSPTGSIRPCTSMDQAAKPGTEKGRSI